MQKLRDSNYGHLLGAPSKGKVSEMYVAVLTMTMHCNQDRAQNPSEKAIFSIVQLHRMLL